MFRGTRSGPDGGSADRSIGLENVALECLELYPSPRLWNRGEIGLLLLVCHLGSLVK